MTATPNADPRQSPSGPRWRFRFGLFTLLVVMTLFSLTAAVASALLKEGFSRATSATYLLAAIAAPLALVVLLGLVKWGQEQAARFRRNRK